MMHDHPRRPPCLTGIFLIAVALAAPGPDAWAGLPTYAAAPDITTQLATLLQRVPCAAVTPRLDGSKLYLSGWVLPGEAWSRFRRDARSIGGITTVDTSVSTLAPFTCRAIDTVSRFVTDTQQASGGLSIRPDERQVSVGKRLGIAVDGYALRAVRLDMYQPDGFVTHLRLTQHGGSARGEESMTAPFGPRLLIALSTPAPLDLDARPSKEPADGFLRALGDALRGVADDEHPLVSAGIAVIDVRPPAAGGPATTAKAAGRSLSPRCAAILQRLQLGETISNAERAALDAECRS